MLERSGITAQIHLDARKTAAGLLEMDAWLVVGEQVVTGGEIAACKLFGQSRAGLD